MSTAREAWARLAAAGLVEGEMPPARTAESPWFVRVMLGFAGWIGALFLLAFGGVLFSSLFDKAVPAILIGAIVCAAAIFLFRFRGDNDFVAQFAFALSLAGQALVVVGIGNLFKEQTAAIALAGAAAEAALFFLAPSFLHRVWTSAAAALAVVVALASWHVAFLAPGLLTVAFAWIWLRELEDPRRAALWRPGGYGLTLAAIVTVFLLNLITDMAFLNQERDGAAGAALAAVRVYAGAVLSGVALILIVVRLLAREGVPLGSGKARMVLAGAVVLALASLAAPGLAPAVAILVLGYANGNRVLAGLGILVLLGYLSYYYYSLETTLLIKSILLMAVGSLLLGVRLALHRWWHHA
jgi:hypothetical protein